MNVQNTDIVCPNCLARFNAPGVEFAICGHTARDGAVLLVRTGPDDVGIISVPSRALADRLAIALGTEIIIARALVAKADAQAADAQAPPALTH